MGVSRADAEAGAVGDSRMIAGSREAPAALVPVGVDRESGPMRLVRAACRVRRLVPGTGLASDQLLRSRDPINGLFAGAAPSGAQPVVGVLGALLAPMWSSSTATVPRKGGSSPQTSWALCCMNPVKSNASGSLIPKIVQGDSALAFFRKRVSVPNRSLSHVWSVERPCRNLPSRSERNLSRPSRTGSCVRFRGSRSACGTHDRTDVTVEHGRRRRVRPSDRLRTSELWANVIVRFYF